MILTLLWISAKTLSLIWAQRQEGKVCTAKTRAQLLARCCLLKEGTGASLQNASTLADILSYTQRTRYLLGTYSALTCKHMKFDLIT